MGYDWRKVPMLREGLTRDWPLQPDTTADEMRIVSNRPEWEHLFPNGPVPFHFNPTNGWRGHIELNGASGAPPTRGHEPRNREQTR